MAIVERPGLRLPRMRLRPGDLPPAAKAGLVLAAAAILLSLVLRPELRVLIERLSMGLGGVAILGFAALVVWAFVRSKGTDARIDAWLAERAEEHKQPIIEPLERR